MRELRFETEIFADAAAVEERIERAGSLGVRAVRWRLAHRGKQRGKIGGVVVDYVVNAVCRGRRIEQTSNGARDIGMMADRHALRRGTPRIIGVTARMCGSSSP